jgi:hypothetical protein
LCQRIETALRSSWLDGDTAHGFKREYYARMGGDLKVLEGLYERINREVAWRKRQYGCGRTDATA